MKKTILMIGALALAIVPASAQKVSKKQAREMQRVTAAAPGVAVSGSTDAATLPQSAKEFLAQVFPGTAIQKVENDYSDRQYEVDMADGYEVTFDYNGNWVQVEAPDGATLPSSTLTALVPEEIVMTTISSDSLLNGGAQNAIEEIYVTPSAYVVEYATGTVGKAKAGISKSTGSVMTAKQRGKDRKMTANRNFKNARIDKTARTPKDMRGNKAMRQGQARPVSLSTNQQ